MLGLKRFCLLLIPAIIILICSIPAFAITAQDDASKADSVLKMTVTEKDGIYNINGTGPIALGTDKPSVSDKSPILDKSSTSDKSASTDTGSGNRSDKNGTDGKTDTGGKTGTGDRTDSSAGAPAASDSDTSTKKAADSAGAANSSGAAGTSDNTKDSTDNNKSDTDKNGKPVVVYDRNTKATKQFLVRITKPDSDDTTTFGKSYVICGNTDESDVRVVLYIYSEARERYVPFKNTEGKSFWDIGSSHIFTKEVILPDKDRNDILIVAFKKAESEGADAVGKQISKFSITVLDESLKDIIKNGLSKINDIVKDMFPK